MTNNHIKSCSTLLMRELPIKTTIRYHYTPTRKTEMKISPNVGKDVEELPLSYFAGMSIKWYDYFGERFDSFFTQAR